MQISRNFMVIGVAYLCLGIVFGMYMSGSGDHEFAPLHAHINLLGFTLMTVFGIVYRVIPDMAGSVLGLAVGLLAAYLFVRATEERGKVDPPDHPDANTRGYVWRHRIVAEEKIGRRLRPEEVVHHIDGDQTNDHPDNLEVYADQAEHAGYHGKTKPRKLIERMFTASPNYQKSRCVRHG